VARPLPVDSISKKNAPGQKGGDAKEQRGTKRKRANAKKDDVPRAFKRLMAFAEGKKVRSGLDDGTKPKAKKNKTVKAAPVPAEPEETVEVPTIKPGEKLSDFAARVDAALPLGGLINKTVRDGKDPLGLKVRRTKKERKLHKLHAQWREEDRKFKERREEELELAEEEAFENEAVDAAAGFTEGGQTMTGKKKTKKGRLLGESGEKEEDPWAQLKRKRGEIKLGLHDVVQAPPELRKTLSRNVLVQGAAVEAGNIPKSAGSLRRREELQGVREDVMASYKKLMEEKRANAPRLQ
jgi:hypothetical protein